MNTKPSYMFLCDIRTDSPSVGIPVYVKDEVLQEHEFPHEFRGGTIIEDLSFEDRQGRVTHCFKVRHKNGVFVWGEDELVEVGAQLNIKVDPNIIPNSRYDR